MCMQILIHYFLYCPSFAALRENLFNSAAQLLGNRWHCASDMKKTAWLVLKWYFSRWFWHQCYAFICFLVQPFLLISFMCVYVLSFCSIATFLLCIVNIISSLYDLFLLPEQNVVINIVYIKKYTVSMRLKLATMIVKYPSLLLLEIKASRGLFNITIASLANVPVVINPN